MRMKKLLSLFLALVMVLSLVPTTVFATGTNNVYISVSYDGKYINDKNGGYIAHVAVPMETVAAINLDDYGLSDYWYDEDGDGTYETTALQLVIYAHENIYGGSWSDVTFTGNPGSSYFQGGIFGFDENLNYYLNGEYPLAGEGWGATSDQIVLEAGDYLDIGSFSSWDFFQDSNYGFHFFADDSGAFTHAYSAEAETTLSVKLVRSFSAMGTGATVYDEAGYEVYYGTTLYNATGSVTTDDSGCADVTFPSAGTWYLWADGGYGMEYPDSIVSTPAYAEVTVTAKETPAPETPRVAQDVSAVLNATMAQMAATVTEPVFGTTAGEWTVFGLARGGYYAKDNVYFTDYYDRIVETVNTTAASVNMNGALHKVKSTENSRLIVALSSIGKDATAVGNWDLVEAYSANGFDWIKKQGINGTIWALIALDSHNYATSDTTIRQQCVDSIVSLQHDDGGWSLMANKTYASDPDITGMALTALYPYRDQPAVAEACAEAIACLSEMQHDNGTFASGGSECSESCAWVIVATTMWGINPDTDSRFIKNGNSVVDGLLAHYVEEEAMFQHVIGGGANAMGTDQSCYALVAYDRFIKGQTALFNYSDVTFDAKAEVVKGEPKAILGLPQEVAANEGEEFNAVISIDQWDNTAGYKLVDFIMTVPEGLSVSDVKASSRLGGGEVSYNVDSEGKLRVVYFDAHENADVTVMGTAFPAELFTVTYCVEDVEKVTPDTELEIAITGMSLKRSSDSTDEDSMVIVKTTDAAGTVKVVEGLSFSAVCLYEGDGVDLIPTDKKAVAVAVIGAEEETPIKLTYDDETNQITFYYSAEISVKSGVPTYVALVAKTIDMESFGEKKHYELVEETAADTIIFGDSNDDGTINAQDALAAVDAWLRKGDAPEGKEILVLNVNGDSRINTFDALGIVERFVDNSDYGVVTKAATITTQK